MKHHLLALGLCLAAPLLAQNPVDPFMGDWQGTITVGGQPQKAAVYMIPLGNGRYEARIVEDFLKRGPYLHQLRGEIRGGQLRFMDNIPFDVNRLIGTTDKGVVLNAALWSGPVTPEGVQGAVAGRLSGNFDWRQTQRTSPNLGKAAPAGAVILFDGKNLDAWRHQDPNRKVEWRVLPEGVMEVRGGNIVSREKFTDFRLHIEFRLPCMPNAFGQGRANSGVYLQGRYEVQVLDSYGLEGADNECGGIYTVSRPRVNMCFPPLQWQSYDIEFRAAKFDANGKKTAPAHVIVDHNGVIIQDTDLAGPTGGALNNREHEPEGIMLQDHSNPVQFRNIWVEKR